jgi:hypothetical protein
MSWANLKEVILQERKQFEVAAGIDFPQESIFESEHSAMLAAYLKTKGPVEGAISYFAERLDWPELSPIEKFFVLARLDFAWEVVSILDSSHDGEPVVGYPSGSTRNSSDLLEWLLIDLWPFGCARFLHTQKMAVEQPNEIAPPPLSLPSELTKAECVA